MVPRWQRRETIALLSRAAQAARLKAGVTHAVSWVQRKIEADCQAAMRRRLALTIPATVTTYTHSTHDVAPDYLARL